MGHNFTLDDLLFALTFVLFGLPVAALIVGSLLEEPLRLRSLANRRTQPKRFRTGGSLSARTPSRHSL